MARIARENDQIVGMDTHIVLMPVPLLPAPMPIPLPFVGPITKSLAPTVFADGKAVAVVGSRANNTPGHVAPGGQFLNPPEDSAEVVEGSSSVKADGKAIARIGDAATSCNDMGTSKNAHVVPTGKTTCSAG
ncbi:MAG: PAAR domain-containing protein [Polyangiaceae bacterium]